MTNVQPELALTLKGGDHIKTYIYIKIKYIKVPYHVCCDVARYK